MDIGSRTAADVRFAPEATQLLHCCGTARRTPPSYIVSRRLLLRTIQEIEQVRLVLDLR